MPTHTKKIMDLTVNRKEPLCMTGGFETSHLPLLCSRMLM
jgi:hypothetical protein